MTSDLDSENLAKLEALKNDKVVAIVKEYIKRCQPSKVTVLTDAKEDIAYMRQKSLENGEEKKLGTEGHTIHFDGMKDQARDKANTKVLLPTGKSISKFINSKDREDGLKEVFGLLDGIMQGKEMIICFFCLGPNNSRFSIPALQITDSASVAHAESILYRPGYEEFKNLNGSENFFFFVHSAGELDERNNSKNVDQRRIYVDLEENRVFTVNNQYAGNAVGLKKLALRLAINKANQEDWLTEHMFLMGAHPPGKDRVTYFAGAFPSACGKTSTAMIPGQSIVGDDIVYMKTSETGECMAVNVEQGIFGIIKDINPQDDPLIYSVLTTPRELIFSNVLVKDNKPYWINMGQDMPEDGENFSGEWKKGKTDEEGKEIGGAHKNARYTVRINELENADPKADDPNGVPVGGVIYGGRDSDTTVPVYESLSWSHGVFVGAQVESETTAAALGQEGVRVHNPMSNLDFLVVPLSTYIKNHLAFGSRLDKVPKIFHTNYFLKKGDGFMNSKLDKKVWLMWMEGRVHNEYKAIETPIGFIPKFGDLKALFKQIFDRDYSEAEYEEQFSLRLQKSLDKITRLEKVYLEEGSMPEEFMNHSKQEKARLEAAKEKFGKDIVSPAEFE